MGRYVDSTGGVMAGVNGTVRRQYERVHGWGKWDGKVGSTGGVMAGVNGTVRRQYGRSGGWGKWDGT